MNVTHYRFSLFSGYPWEQDSMPFLEKRFPLYFLVVFPVLEKILPYHLFQLYYVYKKEILWQKLLTQIGTSIGAKVELRQGGIPNIGPRYYSCVVSAAGTDSYYPKGYGQSFVSYDEACSKALGEFLERFFTSRSAPRQHCQIVSRHLLGSRAVDLDVAACYLPWQKEEVDSSFLTRADLNQMPLEWIKARSLLNGRRKYVPLGRVLYSADINKTAGILGQSSSNGSGAGYTKKVALTSALFELIERDSFLCYWLLGMTPRRIDPCTVLLDEVQKTMEINKRSMTNLYYLDVTTALGIPTVVAVLTQDIAKEKTKVTVGAASGFTLHKLFSHSLLEALCLTQGFSETLDKDDVMWPKHPFREKDLNREKRLNLWRSGAPKGDISWFIDGEICPYKDFTSMYQFEDRSLQGELSNLKEHVHAWIKRYGEGYHPYIYPTAPSKFVSKYGYSAFSVAVMALYPLYLQEHYATLDIDSLIHWRETHETYMESGEEKREFGVNNTIPHPFP